MAPVARVWYRLVRMVFRDWTHDLLRHWIAVRNEWRILSAKDDATCFNSVLKSFDASDEDVDDDELEEDGE